LGSDSAHDHWRVDPICRDDPNTEYTLAFTIHDVMTTIQLLENGPAGSIHEVNVGNHRGLALVHVFATHCQTRAKQKGSLHTRSALLHLGGWLTKTLALPASQELSFMQFIGTLAGLSGNDLGRVSGEYTVTLNSNPISWGGWLRALDTYMIAAGGPLALTLADGRTAFIHVRYARDSTHGEPVSWFTGTGPTPP
jgi:hypothetical protein